jgi:hypothetical protein
MTIQEVIKDRQIQEVVHFTTNHGCLGTIYTGQLQSRKRLSDDPMVKYLFSPNANLRKDVAYLDYVSLSISHLNHEFFRTSSQSWHRDEPIFWCILSFRPEILTHEGVVFSTTNNIYTGVNRRVGADGLAALFDPKIKRWTGNSVSRGELLRSSYPTCFQAETLYPQFISTDYLQRIYVDNNADQSEVAGFLKATFHRDVDVEICPEKFGVRPA